MIFGKAKRVSWATSQYYFQIYILLNGATVICATMSYRGNGGDNNLAIATVRHLSAGDYIELYANQGSGSTLTLGGHSTDANTIFGMVRLVPTVS